MKLNRFNHSRRGSESAEMIIALPVVILVIFAGFEYGWAALKSIQMDHAARVGARVAALSGSTSADVENKVNTALLNSGIVGATLTINPQDPSTAPLGTPITVLIETNYSNVQLLGLSRMMPLPAVLKGRASMVKEPEP